ncbi:MFS transporter [Streptomyces sp. NPDC014622]|uniref:MFS transporter n=1 Tax=Streptomyces sp. NPDC014622 TaxID=3364874 RepID=UPI003703661F
MLLFTAWIVDYIDRLVINLALPSIGEEFGLDHTRQGLILSAFFLAYAVCQIPGGLLADRFGSQRMLSWAMLLWSAFTALTGTAWSFAVLVAIRVLFGLGQGVFPAAAMKAAVERTSPRERMTATGLIQSSNPFGAFAAPLITAPLIALWGWRMSFFAVAGLGVLVWVAIRMFLPPARPEASAEAPEQATGAGRGLLTSGVMWRFALMFFGYGIVVWGLNSWIPSYLQSERGISLTNTGVLSAIPAAVGGLTLIVGGRVSDRLQGRQRLTVAPAMLVSAAAILAMFQAHSLTAFIVLLSVAMAACTFCYTPIFTLPLRTLPAGLVGTGSGMINFGCQVAGILVPVLMGYLIDHYSYDAAFLCLAAGAALSAVFALFTPQTSQAFRTRLGLAAPQTPDEL